MIFKNLCGKNFSGNDYQNYLRTVCQDIGVTTAFLSFSMAGIFAGKDFRTFTIVVVIAGTLCQEPTFPSQGEEGVHPFRHPL